MTELVIQLKKDYVFEGETFKSIDLSNLENISGLDLIKAKRKYTADGGLATVVTTDMEYCLIVAAIATSLPQAFFEGLTAPLMNKVYMRVMGFLMSESEE